MKAQRTELQIAASANASLSTAPATAEGKAHTAQNAAHQGPLSASPRQEEAPRERSRASGRHIWSKSRDLSCACSSRGTGEIPISHLNRYESRHSPKHQNALGHLAVIKRDRAQTARGSGAIRFTRALNEPGRSDKSLPFPGFLCTSLGYALRSPSAIPACPRWVFPAKPEKVKMRNEPNPTQPRKNTSAVDAF
jgi:hypothetical protein